MSIFTPIHIIAAIIAMVLNWTDPAHEYASYCTPEYTYCVVEADNDPDLGAVFQVWPTECVDGRWMMVNRTGSMSFREDVYDVGPWNNPSTVWGGCSTIHQQ